MKAATYSEVKLRSLIKQKADIDYIDRIFVQSCLLAIASPKVAKALIDGKVKDPKITQRLIEAKVELNGKIVNADISPLDKEFHEKLHIFSNHMHIE